MRKVSTQQCAFLRFLVPLLLLVSFCYAPYSIATKEVSGNEVNTDGKLVKEELPKTNQEHEEEAKFKGFFPKPLFKKPIPKSIPIIKPIPKPIPIVKPIPKLIPVIKPIHVPIYKPIPKVVPIVKPIPIIKPVLKPVPTAKPIHIVKPVLKPIPIVKPIPKPFIVKKPIPTIEQGEFLKPKPSFKKPIHKLPLHPKIGKPLVPRLSIHKPILAP